ncbi:uncharacterized protein LOC132886621 isoform X2 [Neoarius graeffei]|uniref:uncharacterized protein LOC132886621 isoform X2 n=1 Tax=Neoarius graeffei TaxID=443677 RepID=UPI00298C00C2|nr:uncharacterized protein LOC132886621 isoform X2 [Neoarius graeffei]
MPEFSQCAWWMFFISILLLFLPCGGRSGSSGHQHPNGTITFNLDETVPVSQHDTWLINNVVQANEMSFNTTTIESRGLRYVTFKKCYENVTYWSADPGKSISFLYSGRYSPIYGHQGAAINMRETPGTSGRLGTSVKVPKDREDSCFKYLAPKSDNCTVAPIQDPHSDILVGVIVASILCAVALLCIGCRYWKTKRLRRWHQN